MGEIAESMIDGTLCEGCGEYLVGGQKPVDVALLCAGCAVDRRQEGHVVLRAGSFFQDAGEAPPVAKAPKIRCPQCFKKVSPSGLEQHRRDRHGPVST